MRISGRLIVSGNGILAAVMAIGVLSLAASCDSPAASTARPAPLPQRTSSGAAAIPPDSPPAHGTPSASFTGIYSGEVVSPEMSIGVSFKNISPGKLLWVVVDPISTGEYWPQDGAIDPGNGGSPSVDIHFGNPGAQDSGKKYVISIVEVSTEVSSQYADHLNNPKTNQEGITGIPDGKSLAHLQVTRS